MLDFAVRGAFITAETPAQRDFILAAADEVGPLAAALDYPHLSTGRADKDNKIAYLEFTPARGQDTHSGPSAKIEIYPLEGKNEKQLSEFLGSLFKFGAGGEAPKILKLDEATDKDGNAAIYAERLVMGRAVYYSAAFRRGARLVAITLRPGADPDNVPGKEKLRKLIAEGKTQ